MNSEQYQQDRIGQVVGWCQANPVLALLAVACFYGLLLLVASANRTPPRGGSRR